MDLHEALLQYIWQFKLFNTRNLCSSTGEKLEILHTGFKNPNAGPDFLEAQIRIDQTLWVGQVEIHKSAADWYHHKHHLDLSYDNVILHVVYEADRGAAIYRKDASAVPCLVLKPLVNPELFERYAELMAQLEPLPCGRLIHTVDMLHIQSMVTRCAIERLEQKTTSILALLKSLNGDWAESFYRLMAKNFGFKVNALPFEMLAAALPQRWFQKHRKNPKQIEALVFGTAGLLQGKFKDTYPVQLQQEYQYLKVKYQLKPLEPSLWKFARMHPQNFPSLRLAQFSALIVRSYKLFSTLLKAKSLKELNTFFKNLPVSAYWQSHLRFDRVGQAHTQIGDTSIQLLTINTLAPCLYAYGTYINKAVYRDRAIALLEDLPAENNHIIRYFKNKNITLQHALDSQGLLQLYTRYCSVKKCLSCSIGLKILKYV